MVPRVSRYSFEYMQSEHGTHLFLLLSAVDRVPTLRFSAVLSPNVMEIHAAIWPASRRSILA